MGCFRTEEEGASFTKSMKTLCKDCIKKYKKVKKCAQCDEVPGSKGFQSVTNARCKKCTNTNKNNKNCKQCGHQGGKDRCGFYGGLICKSCVCENNKEERDEKRGFKLAPRHQLVVTGKTCSVCDRRDPPCGFFAQHAKCKDCFKDHKNKLKNFPKRSRQHHQQGFDRASYYARQRELYNKVKNHFGHAHFVRPYSFEEMLVVLKVCFFFFFF